MVRPKPCVLFAQSFLHPALAEYVDEVRFTEPVVICACEFLELHTSSLCPTLSLSGVSFPQSFALEIFVRIGGEARFKRLCPAFLYSPSATSILEVQAAVTDHLVIRGSYRALSLVVYGNSVKELGQFNFDHEIDNTLSDAIVPSEAVFKPEDLPEALQDERGYRSKLVSPLRNLQLVYNDPEQSEAMHQLLSLAVQFTKSDPDQIITARVFDILLSAASTVVSEHGIESGFPQWPILVKTPAQSQRKVKHGLKQARDQIQVVNAHRQNNVMLDKSSPALLLNVSTILEAVFDWIQRSFQLSSKIESDMSAEEYLMGGLAAVQLLCTDAHWCFQLVVAGGLHLLMNVLQYTSAESSATVLLILGALKCACQHAFACEALLGWWPTNALPAEPKHRVSFGYSSVLKTLLQTKRQNVSQLACEVLHHLHAYQLASEFQCEVQSLLEISDVTGKPASTEHTIKKLNISLKGLVSSLNAKDFPQDLSPAQMAEWFILDGDDNAFTLPPNAIFSWISASKYSFAFKDLNAHILLVLQERRFIPSLAALLSVPWMRSAVGKFKDSFLEFIGNVEALILSLISSRSGLLFLASDKEAAEALVSALVGVEELEGRDSINLRHAYSLMSAGFICKTQDIGHMLCTNLSVIAVIDHLLGTPRHSESFLWLLWELSVFSRSEVGRQALSSIAYFPEVFVLLVEALQPESQSLTTDIKEARALNRAFLHSAAEVMQVILIDPVASSLAAWIPHALSLQKALQYCSPTTIDIAVGSHGLGSGNKDALCARLLDWVDAAVIFHKKGPVGLLRYAAALVVGSVTSVAVGGLPTSDPVEVDNTFGESAVSTELPTVNTLLGRGVMLGASGTVLPDTAVIQLTVSMRIMSSVSCHPGMAAVLYGEGAMPILYILLEYSAGVLQSSTIDYDYMVEEDGEDDGIIEMILEQEREQSLLGLLLPTVLLLLSLLKRLQLTGEEYRNTRLVEILLQLHRSICSRLASKVSVLPQAAGMLVLASVSRVLASILAFWPVFGWMPPLFPKLLGLNISSLVQTMNLFPLEPKEAVSILWILGDMLPEESPQLCTNRILAMDISRSLAIATLLGVKSMKYVGWHCELPESEKLIQAMGLHLDHISLMVFHLASTASMLLQGLLIKLVVRMACQSQDNAAALVRPILTLLRENTASGVMAADNEVLRVEQFLELLKELVRHPTTKKVLLREGIVQVLLQASKGKSIPAKMEVKSCVVGGSPTSVRLSCLILDILVAVCDPEISMYPKSPLNRRLAKDCPSFVEYCAIVAWTYNYVLSVPLGKELDIAVQSLCKIVSHQLGRAAFASIALTLRRGPSLSSSFQNDTTTVDAMDMDTQDIGYQIAEGTGSFVPFCKRLAVALTESADAQLVLGILDHFSLAAIQLSAAGRSACGLGALQLLFEMDKMETKEILTSVVALLKSRSEGTIDESYKDVTKLASLKALKSVTALLRLLDNLPAMMFLEKKVKLVVEGLRPLQPFTDEDSCFEEAPPQWRLLPQLFYEAEEDAKGKWVFGCVEENDGTFEDMLKEKFSWECVNDLSDKPSTAGIVGKRKAANTTEGGSKKHSADGGTNGPATDVVSSVNGSLPARGSGTISSTSASTRRDTFRQRKPNTSRPPSMHVDDYVARERGNEISTVMSGSMNQRSALGGGRPPSIHVDEFMARQRERQQVVGASTGVETQPPVAPPAVSQVENVKVESSTSSGRARPILPEEDLQDVDIEVDGVPDTDDLLSLPLGNELVVPDGEESTILSTNVGKASMEVHLSSTSLPVGNEKVESGRRVTAADVSTTDDTLRPMQLDTAPQPRGSPIRHQPVQGEGSEPNVPRNNLPDSLPSASLNLTFQVPQGIEIASTLGISLQLQEPTRTMFASHVSHIGDRGPGTPHDAGSLSVPLHRNPAQFIAVAPPPPLPPPPPIPAGVIPEKYESSPGGSRMPPHLPDYRRGITDSSSATMTVTTAVPLLPPPPRPSVSWQPADPSLGRIEQGHVTPISSITYGTVPLGHVSNPQVGTGSLFSHAPLPPWPNMPMVNEEAGSLGTGRLAPPLPPTPPPFSSSQTSVLQAPVTANMIPHSPSPYQNIGRMPSESTSLYSIPSTMDSSSIDKRFGAFSLPTLGSVPQPPALLSTFQPPLPPGRPNMSQGPLISGIPSQQHQHFHPSQQQILQPAPTSQFSGQAVTTAQPQQFQQPIHQAPVQQQSQGSQQQESGNLLQQILASPEAIQDLLKDQNKLQSLLEQHPKLISLLQEKMGQG